LSADDAVVVFSTYAEELRLILEESGMPDVHGMEFLKEDSRTFPEALTNASWGFPPIA
jgi:hypothetical protein